MNDYVNNQLSLKNVSTIYDELPILFKFKPFELTPVIEDQAKLKQQTGVAFVGFLIKKHIVLVLWAIIKIIKNNFYKNAYISLIILNFNGYNI